MKCALRELIGLEFLTQESLTAASDYASGYDRNRIYIDTRSGVGRVRPQNSNVANIGKFGKKWIPIVGTVSATLSIKPIATKCANECIKKSCSD